MKYLLTVLTCAVLLACQPNKQVFENKVDGFAISHRTTDMGVDCVVYRVSNSYKSGGGISCNWDKYNKENNRINQY